MNYHLVITTFKGLCPDAQHYYGSIHSKALASRAEIELFNEKGEYITKRFMDRRQVIHLAKAWFKEHAKPGDVLFESHQGLCDPCRVLAAYVKPGTLKRANEVWRNTEQIGRWEGNEKLMQVLCDVWDALWLGVGVKTYE